MKAPVSWIRDYVDLPAEVGIGELTDRLTMLGLKLEAITTPADAITGPLVVGRVLTQVPEPQKNGKTINWCHVDVGAELNAEHGADDEPGVGIVCGAHNFGPGDLIVACLPGAVLPGDFAIGARKTYGHLSSGMICSASELGLPADALGSADGIIVLPENIAEPGVSAFEVLGMDDPVIEFEINPDRAYALSLRGIAREAALAFDAPYRDPADRAVPETDGDGYPVEVQDSEGCPVFATRVVTGFDTGARTPQWMAKRLEQAGMRSISLGVDISNYVMLETGQPNHCYDRDALQGAIVVRRASQGEQIVTLDDVTRTLTGEDLVIADGAGPIGIAGVMGGERAELSASSSAIVVEAAYFDPVTVFRARRRHKLPSEAAKRFERGVDPRLAAAAADRVVELLCELGGATAEPGFTQVGLAPDPVQITIDADLPARISGLEISAETTRAHLEAVGCTITEHDGVLTAVVPSWRPDLTDPYDLVEEVVRIVGYDRIPSVLPRARVGHGRTLRQRLQRRIGVLLAGAGWTEAITYPFVGEQVWDDLGLAADDDRRVALRMANPLRAEQPLLTTTLLPGILTALARNVARANDDVALFEHSLVFRPNGTESTDLLSVEQRPSEQEWERLRAAIPAQPMHLALAVAGNVERSGWWGEGRTSTWADAVGAVGMLAEAVGVELAVEAAARAPWHPGRCARFSLDDVEVGFAGELHPRVCRALGVPERTAVAEIDLDALLDAAVEVVQAPRLSVYPPAKEDVALVVDADVPSADVAAALADGAGELLESVRLFDVYTGDQVAAGRKSLAFALRFRAGDRTLAEGEAAAARDAAVAAAAERVGAVQR